MVVPVIMYGCESWTMKKAECRRIDAFELWYWRSLLKVPWTARRANQSILKEISPEYSLEGLMLKLKLHALATWCEELTHLKRPWRWERLKGTTDDEVVGWHQRLDGPEFEEALGIGDGQGIWHAAVHGVTKSRTWLSDWTSHVMITKLFTSYGLNRVPSQIHMLKFHFWEPENVTLFENKVWKC